MTPGGGIYPGCLCMVVGRNALAGRVVVAVKKVPHGHVMLTFSGGRILTCTWPAWWIDACDPFGQPYIAAERFLRPLQPPPETRIVDILRPEPVEAFR